MTDLLLFYDTQILKFTSNNYYSDVATSSTYLDGTENYYCE